MAIDYRKPKPAPISATPTHKSTSHGLGAILTRKGKDVSIQNDVPIPIREVPIPRMETLRQLRYYTDAYNRLTAEIATANLLNNDKWRKEKINTSQLYRLRANAAAQMAIYSNAILTVHGY